MTLKLESPKLESGRMVMGIIARIAGSKAAGELGKISIYKEQNAENVTAVFDVPEGAD